MQLQQVATYTTRHLLFIEGKEREANVGKSRHQEDQYDSLMNHHKTMAREFGQYREGIKGYVFSTFAPPMAD